eukprot:CAMPEP_0169149438 /NCGR_PEP_ID=MMETSP1015-20121227/49523_1 /TAXON_ID=342587 /ORGANISM="Karlodinium micrum, Strain CCMP2283" /LENGTH=374 /DNA_ID=CAMNT_0009218251 /DNA_START=940 /DNA_END=2061 /DNA_ORIENTATION=+
MVAVSPTVWMTFVHKESYCLWVNISQENQLEVILGRTMVISNILCLFMISLGLVNLALGVIIDFQTACDELLIILYLSSTSQGRRSLRWVKGWKVFQNLKVKDEGFWHDLKDVESRKSQPMSPLSTFSNSRDDEIAAVQFKDWRSLLNELRDSDFALDKNCVEVVNTMRDSVKTQLEATHTFRSLKTDFFMFVRTWQRFGLRVAQVRLQNLFLMGLVFACASLLTFHANLWEWDALTSSSWVSMSAIIYSAGVLLCAIASIVKANSILFGASVTMLIEWKDFTLKAAARIQDVMKDVPFVSRARMAIDTHSNALLSLLDYSIQHIKEYERPEGLVCLTFTERGVSAVMYTMLGALASLVFRAVLGYARQAMHKW